ncbi:alginate export family protein [Lysobacter yangpyeongensis]|uniref:Alginate export family protein n=1 Tax=Lysobacter yangpyeongensis TaxID=346182 RepID=A0ABW0SIH6_9GAMM
MSRPTRPLVHAGLLSLFLPPVVVAATHDENNAAHARCAGTTQAGALAPVPADPYPLMAAGWGPESGRGLMASRWAEDWSGVRNAGRAPAFKAMALGDAARLTLSSEVRLRHAVSDNAKLVRGDDFAQTQLRAIVGADLRVDPHLRVYGELGTARVDTRRATATPNFRNDLALQQLFADMHVVGRRDGAGDTLLGVMIGRQEFSDGPRQLISLSDGPNLHRSWNGVRLYAHGARYRVGAFDLRATRLGHGGFDETTDHAEALRGLTASFIVSRGEGPNTYLDPFWFHTTNPRLRVAGRTGRDDRDTIGARLWGRVGAARFDWTAVRQSGNSIDGRRIDAWGIFAVQSLALSDDGWKARMTSRVDVASGGGAYGSGPIRDFHPLYASSNYLGEGQFLGLSNLLMVTPGIALSPTPHTTLSFEYGHARRLRTNDAVYAGGLRAYAGTQDVSGHDVGRLARVSGNWNATPNLSLSMNVEHFATGDALARAGYPSGHYAYVSATYRY